MSDRRFPVMRDGGGPGCPQTIPWAMIEPFEPQAKRNHDQSLDRLARRGGLSPIEIIWVVSGVRWRGLDIGKIEAVKRLNSLVSEYQDRRYEH